jgi:hypothetical protein
MNAEVRDHLNFLKGAFDLLTAGTTADTGTTMRLIIVHAAAADLAFQAYVTGDTHDRWGVQSNGKMMWGGGGGVPDITLERLAGGVPFFTGRLGASSIVGQVLVGTPTDANVYQSATDGAFIFDSNANKIWVRLNNVWKYVALT